ncbi:MAG: sensor histidine kinase [Lachnospiraceae bacterium]|nr:sensor histidine kinase [Lachnospiraceae bacterium]MDY4068484.1 sensor histidine kinase [Lachnospiraceae bacterium]
MKAFIRKSFKRELFLCFTAVALVPLVISGCFLISALEKRISQDYERKTAVQLKTVEDTMLDYFDDVREISEQIMEDPVILRGITESDSWLKNRAYMELYDKTQAFREIAQFDIYDAEGNCRFSTSPQGVAEDLPSYWGILKVARTHPDELTLRRVSQYRTSENVCLQGALAIMDETEECLGFVVVDVTKAHFETLLAGTYDEQNGIAILDSYWEDVYSTRTAKEEKLAQALRARRMAGENLKQTTDGITFYISPMAETGLYVVLGRSPIFTGDVINTMIGVMVMMAFASFLLCLLAAGIMSNYLTAPVKKLSEAMHRVENGDLDVQLRSHRKDELGQLSGSFDVMARELKENIALQIRQQAELNDSNIAMMQAQLNPHFLYNTLDTIKWTAKSHHVPELATLASGLAKILRTSISEAKFVKLEEELNLVSAYMEIQKIRFDGNFSYDIEVPTELEDCIVPKLIVQPIVENAIIHGLKEREHGHIFVYVYEEEGKLYIDVSDDGCGIEEAVLALLRDRDRERLKGHIGFYNVDTILRLYYGEEYGLFAENLESGGARIRISLPVERVM